MKNIPESSFQVTIFTKDNGVLTKAIKREGNGKLIKDNTKCLMASGTAETIPLENMNNFAEVLQELEHNQALSYGISGQVPVGKKVKVVSKKKLEAHPGAIARTSQFFQFSERPSIMMIDYDPPKGAEPLQREALLEMVRDVIPDLNSAPHAWSASASSCIYSEEGEELSGISGQRVYMLVSSGGDIEKAGKRLHERLWLRGHGYFAVSSVGYLLNRSAVDSSVYQAQRLDFAAGAKCMNGLQRKRPAPVVYNSNAEPLDLKKAIRKLSKLEKATVKELESEAKNLVSDEAAAKRGLFVERAVERALANGEDGAKAEELALAAVTEQRLGPSFMIKLQSGQSVSVDEIMKNPKKYHGQRCADPLEPGYRNDNRIGYISISGRGHPAIFSHAHGRRVYRMGRARKEIEIIPGEAPTLLRAVNDVLADAPDLYELGGEIVYIDNSGKPRMMGAASLLCEFEEYIKFTKNNQVTCMQEPADAPNKLGRAFMELRGKRKLRELTAAVRWPTITANGRVIDQIGYDLKTKILYAPSRQETPYIPKEPTAQQIEEALRVLWEPFALFPFADNASRGVCLAAILTQFTRAHLDTCPLFMFEASQAGSGKTLMAQTIGLLVGDELPASPLSESEDERRKVLMAALLEGRQNILFDNIEGELKSPSLCGFVSSKTYSDRVLNKSMRIEIANRSTVFLTGNNPIIVGDLSRRMVRCRLVPTTENHSMKKFSFNPKNLVRANMEAMAVAAITLMRGMLLDTDSSWQGPANSIGSFEAWDRIVRRTVVWCGEVHDFPVVDPVISMERGRKADPERESFSALLKNAHSIFKGGAFTIKAMLESVSDDVLEAIFWCDSAIAWGRYLSRKEGEICGGLRIESFRGKGKTKMYCVRSALKEVA